MIPRSTRAFTEDLASQNGYDSKDIIFLNLLIKDYPNFRFTLGPKFTFRPPRTIVIGPKEPFSRILTLHELGHAISRHKQFRTHVERLKMENEAWEEAKKLATHYNQPIDEDMVQNELDTYRDWLHQKSRCPKCGLTRFQTPDGDYHCPRCEEL